jgi:hypothetical protein
MESSFLFYVLIALGALSTIIFLASLYIKPVGEGSGSSRSERTNIRAAVAGKSINLSLTLRTFTGVFSLLFFVMAIYFKNFEKRIPKVDTVLYVTLLPDSTNSNVEVNNLHAFYRENILDTTLKEVKIENATSGQLRIVLTELKGTEIFELKIEDKLHRKRWTRRNIPVFNINADLPIDSRF